MKKGLITILLCAGLFCHLSAQRDLTAFMPNKYDAVFYLNLKAIGEAGNLPALKNQLLKMENVKENDFLRSWISGKDKCGIDFNAIITGLLYMDEERQEANIYLYVPLKNRKTFEKMVKKEGVKPEKITTPAGNAYFMSENNLDENAIWNDNMLILNLKIALHENQQDSKTEMIQLLTENHQNLQQDPNFARFWAQQHQAGALCVAKSIKKVYHAAANILKDSTFLKLALLYDAAQYDNLFVNMDLRFKAGAIEGVCEYFGNQEFINRWQNREPFDKQLLQYGFPNAVMAATLNLNKENIREEWINLWQSANLNNLLLLNQLYQQLSGQAALTAGMNERGIMNVAVTTHCQNKTAIVQWLTDLQQQHNTLRTEQKKQYDSLRQHAVNHEIKEIPLFEDSEVISADALLEDTNGIVETNFWDWDYDYNPQLILEYNRMINSDLYTLYSQYEAEHGEDYSNECYADTAIRYYISCKDDGYLMFSTDLTTIQQFDASQMASIPLFEAMGDNINRPFHFQTVKLNTLEVFTKNEPAFQNLEEVVITVTDSGITASLKLKDNSTNALEWLLREYIRDYFRWR